MCGPTVVSGIDNMSRYAVPRDIAVMMVPALNATPVSKI